MAWVGKSFFKEGMMANVLKIERQVAVIGALAEGTSIRSVERMTGIHRDTVMRLAVRVGEGCAELLDGMMRNLTIRRLELDEIWGFIAKKQRRITAEDPVDVGDVWTFVAIDADSKLVPAFRCGKRDSSTTGAFLQDLKGRLVNRVQLSSDGMKAYADEVDKSFGMEVDYAQVVKTYGVDEAVYPEGKYSPPAVTAIERTIVQGEPDPRHISTSYVERQNLTMRMHVRRLTRLTNAFSKKFENFQAAVALHFAYYNLVKQHGKHKATPAMAAGITREFWTVRDLLDKVL